MNPIEQRIKYKAQKLQDLLRQKDEFQQGIRMDIDHLINISERGHAKKLAARFGGFQEREQLLAPEDDLDLDRQRSPVRLLGRSFRAAGGPKHARHP